MEKAFAGWGRSSSEFKDFAAVKIFSFGLTVDFRSHPTLALSKLGSDVRCISVKLAMKLQWIDMKHS